MKQTPDDLCGGSTPGMFGIARLRGPSLQFFGGKAEELRRGVRGLLALFELRQPVAEFVDLAARATTFASTVEMCRSSSPTPKAARKSCAVGPMWRTEPG